MKIGIKDIIAMSLALFSVGAIASQNVQAKSYTYKYKLSESIKSSLPDNSDGSEPVIIERPMLRSRIVERPPYIRRTIARPIIVQRRIIVRRPIIVERPILVQRRCTARPYYHRVVSRPIYVHRIVERQIIRPVCVSQYPLIAEPPVYVEHCHRGLISKLFSLIF